MPKCTQCGTCCTKGGPTLHQEDLELLLSGHLGPEQLIAIRQGEPVFSPLTGAIEPAQKELIKLTGSSGSWSCVFYNRQQGLCANYDHRPLECRLLQCWDLKQLLPVIYHQPLGRRDILPPEDPMLAFIDQHDQEYPFAQLALLGAGDPDAPALAALTRLIRGELSFRANLVNKFNLTTANELFLFGRPMFASLAFYRLELVEGNKGIQVRKKSMG